MNLNNIKKSRGVKIKKVYALIFILFGGIILLDMTPLGGNIEFYQAWVQCGQKPVSTKGPGPMNSGAAHYYEPPLFGVLRPSIDYFCTPLEAEEAGYSAVSHQYQFPNIERERAKDAK